ncbi:MAG: MarR family transcriptional regulator [Desulfocapsaceae bacterium]
MDRCSEKAIGRRIFMASQALRNHIQRILKPFDLTSEQLHILKNIDQQCGTTQRELCGLAGKSPANVTRILDRLEKKQLIVRRVNPDDRRSSLVFLTEPGAELSSVVSHLFQRLSACIEENIETNDMAVVNRVLDQIDANLQKLPEELGE